MADFPGDHVPAPEVYLASAEQTTAPGAFLLNVVPSDPTPPDTEPPLLTNFVPAVGSLLSSPHQPIQFDIQDLSGELAAVIIRVRQRGQKVTEMVFEYDQFVEPYSEFSTYEILEDGTWRMVLRRSGGWRGTPLLRAFALDKSGNINV
jgi:hypothetical protein